MDTIVINKKVIEHVLRIFNKFEITDAIDQHLYDEITYNIGTYFENRKHVPQPHNMLKLEDFHICYTYDVLNGNKADYSYNDLTLFNDSDADYLEFCGKEVLLFSKYKYTTYQNVKDHTCVAKL
jgi:hypothetical protein